MAHMTRIELFPAVYLTAVHTTKFKSSALSVSLLTPLDRSTAALNALLPAVLRRGSVEHPDMESISAALDELYGGAIEPQVRSRGESQAVGFVASFLDDAYSLDGSPVLEPAAHLLGELLLRPCTENGVFRSDYFNGERDNLLDRIHGQMNDKRSYASIRLRQEMCPDEPYGTPRLGDADSAAAITPETLWVHYQQLLTSAPVELYYCGTETPERAAEILRSAFAALPVSQDRKPLPRPVRREAPSAPRMVEERMDVTQGKLSLGLRSDIDAWDPRFPALLVANTVYGGGTTSRLFLHVREKLSLCYYASSQLDRLKGVMLVSSGVEFEHFEEAKKQILAQLDVCRRGEFEDWELESARRAIVSALLSSMDAQGRMEDYWFAQAMAGSTETAEALAQRVEAVTRDEVVSAFATLRLDTIYFLNGKED